MHAAGQTLSLVDGSGVTIVSTVLTSDDIANGSFLFTYTVPGDGTYSFTSKVSSAGNTQVSGSTLTVTVDNRLPGAPGAPDMQAQSDTGVSSADNITSSLAPSFRIDISGVLFGQTPLQTSDIVRLYVDGAPTATLSETVTTQELANGYIDFAPTLSSGSHTITATAETPAGTTSNPSRPLVIQIDTTGQAPAGTPDLISADDTGSNTSDNITSISAPGFAVSLGSSGAVAGDTVELVKGGVVIGSYVLTAADVSSGTANVSVSSALADGTHSIASRIKDRAFNEGSLSNTIVVTINSAIPTTPTIAISNSSDSGASNTDRLTNSISPVLTGTATTGTTVKIYIGGVYAGSVLPSGGNWSWTVTPALVNDGSYSFTALIEDSAGNESGLTAPVSLTLDKSAPNAPTVSDLSVNVSTPSVSGTAEAGSIVKLYEGSNLVGTSAAGSNGIWSITTSALSEGSHTLTATATDAAGNTSAVSLGGLVKVDTVAPVAPVVNALSPYSLSPVITGTGEVAAAVALFDGATQIGSATVASDSTWTVVVTPALSNSAHSFTAIQTDAAGNTSVASSPAQTISNVMAAALTAADSNAANDNINLTAAQYATAGITGIDSAAKASTLNDAIDGLATSNVNTTVKIQALADAVSKIFELATTGATTPALTISQLQLLGLQNVSDPGALNAIVAAIAATPDDASGVDSLAEIQSVIDGALTAFQDALAKIIAFDEATSTGVAIPTKSTYDDAGISRVDTSDVAILNTYVSALDNRLIDTSGEVQAIVDLYQHVMLMADGGSAIASSLTLSDVQKLGLSASGQSGSPNANIDTAAELNLFNSILDASTNSAVNSYSKIVNLASIAERVLTQAAGQSVSPSLTIYDFAAIGVPGVTAANLPGVLSAIAATNNDGSEVDTLAELKALIASAISTINANALNKIAQFDGTSTSPSLGAPTLDDFTNAGVAGVTNSNQASINSAIATLTYGATDSLVEVQAVVDGYLQVLLASDGLENHNAALTQQNVTGLGLSMINGPAELGLFNSVIDTRDLSGVDTYLELVNLASTADRIIRISAGETVTPTLTPADFSAFGVSGVTEANSSYVLAAVAASADDGSAVDTLTELSNLVSDAIVAAYQSALQIISSYDGTSNTTTPTISDYANANVSGVTSANLAAINALLSATPSTSRDSTGEIQAIVNAYLLVLNAANGVDNSVAVFSQATYADLGMSSINTASKQALATDVIDNASRGMVDSVSDLSAIASGVNAVILTALGQSPNPPVSPELLAALGINGMNSDNSALVISAIAATADDGSGVATRAQVQAIVDSVSSAQASALTIISSYSGAGTTIPLAQTYLDAGITFTVSPSAAEISSLNSVVAELGSAQTDSRGEVQALADSVAAILAAADGLANSNANITQAQLVGIGLSAIDSAVETSLFNSVLDGLSQSAVDTFTELNALAGIIDRLMSVAAGQTYAPELTPSDFAKLGISGVTSSNLSEVLNAISDTANNGSGISTMQLLSSLISQTVSDVTAAALVKISAFTDSAAAGSPTVRDFANVNVVVVTDGNIGPISAYLASIPQADRDSTSEIQNIVDAYLVLIAAANGADNSAATISQTTFTSLGMGAINEAEELALATDVLDNLTLDAINTPAELTNIASAVNAVIQTAAGNSPNPAIDISLMSALGISGVTPENLKLVVEAIAATADNGSGVATKAQIQSIVDGVIASQAAALTVISEYVGDPSVVPTLNTYSDAGVVFVTQPPAELTAYINSFIEILPASETNSLPEVQVLVDLITELYTGADGISNQNVDLTWQEFQLLGFVDVSNSVEASAKNEAIDVLNMAAITTSETPVIEVVVPKDQALALDITPPVFANLEGVDHYAYRYSSDGGQTWTDYGMAAKLPLTQPATSQSIFAKSFSELGVANTFAVDNSIFQVGSQVSPSIPSVDSIEINNLENRVTYLVKVRAVTVAGPSQVSVPKTGTPDAPAAAPIADPSTPSATPEPGAATSAAPSKAPKAPKTLYQLPAGSSTAQIGGKPANVKVERVNDSTIVASIPGVLEVSMMALGEDKTPLPISKNGSLLVNKSGLVAVQGDGLKPGSEVEVWLRSTPVHLGTVITGASGEFEGSLRLPLGIAAGQHTVNLVGVLPSGEAVTLALGIEVVDEKPQLATETPAPQETEVVADGSDSDSANSAGTGWSGKAMAYSAISIMLLIGTLIFWFIIWRRRRDEDEEEFAKLDEILSQDR